MQSESKLQSDCFIWSWNTLPETRGLICYNLNNSRNRIDGAMNKSLGLIAGRSDMVLYWHGRAIFIEFKIPGGKQSPEQRKWEALVTSSDHGFEYHIVTSLEQFQQLILSHVK
jgi:hypothetical protein